MSDMFLCFNLNFHAKFKGYLGRGHSSKKKATKLSTTLPQAKKITSKMMKKKVI